MLACRVEVGLHLGHILLQIARTLFLWNAGHQCVASQVVFGNQHRGEELGFKRHPVNGFLNLFVNLLAGFVQIVGAPLLLVVGE